MINVKDLHVHYKNIHVLNNINLNIEKGQIVTIIGANGAGKSTTLKTLSGLVKSSSGTIELLGKNANNKSASWWVKERVIHCPEGRQIFPRMSVQENLDLGAFLRKDRNIKKDIDYVYELFPILKDRRNQQANTLSGGEQQMLAIGRSLMSSPDLLMLDEPSLGLAPMLVKKIFNIICHIRETGKTILLVEQNAKMALQVADYGYVLQTGSIIFEGKQQELMQSELIKQSYLGENEKN